MKKIIVIPSRLASSRLPNKPLADIGGEPMIIRVLNQARLAKCDQVIVACCDERLKSIIEKAGGKAVLTDPMLPSGTDRVYAASQAIKTLSPEDIIINLQGDLPFISPAYISFAATLLEQNTPFDITTLAAPIQDAADIQNPSVVKVAFSPLDQQKSYGFGHYFSRAPIPHGATTFYHHIGIYAFRKAALEKFVAASPSALENTERLEQLRALDLGLKIGVGIVDEAPLSVDTPDDLNKARLSSQRRSI